ncbi:GGDEF domain-containing protein [Siccirubricoccus sp. G192]|uniref:GGDEF domain-containing protein n=1 Tax=Siccirubricoccus sp. G192 TaxID=2849651 RepID=UPI001C2BE24E|nr:GGDEF domain-containing protein [Siccirubricoccus sp. G192]MBV1799051.1 GGDEF domain-containing protein [Siccirubricoccus sp. G192]
MPPGGFAGLRGTARDVTAEIAESEAQAAALRRAAALETMVRRVRQEVLAPRMLTAMLEALPPALGCAGAAMLECQPAGGLLVGARHGADPTPLLTALQFLPAIAAPRFLAGPGGEHLALLPQPYRATPRHALLVWRAAGGREFDADDRHLLASLADLTFVTLSNQVLQRELELQARTEGLTGLLNRRAFLEDLRRRLDRLAQAPEEHRPGGALLFIDLDNFKPINDLLGHEAGDAALVAVAGLLREMVRPTDLVARIGGDEFALWLQGADAAAAADRAAAICAAATTLLPPLLRSGAAALTFSIGCARPGHGVETPEALLARADAAMYVAKRAGRNAWSVAPEIPP